MNLLGQNGSFLPRNFTANPWRIHPPMNNHHAGSVPSTASRIGIGISRMGLPFNQTALPVYNSGNIFVHRHRSVPGRLRGFISRRRQTVHGADGCAWKNCFAVLGQVPFLPVRSLAWNCVIGLTLGVFPRNSNIETPLRKKLFQQGPEKKCTTCIFLQGYHSLPLCSWIHSQVVTGPASLSAPSNESVELQSFPFQETMAQQHPGKYVTVEQFWLYSVEAPPDARWTLPGGCPVHVPVLSRSCAGRDAKIAM